MFFIVSSVLLGLIPFVASQTSTNCDPTKKSCPDDAAFGASTTFNFQETGVDRDWIVLGSGEKISQDGNGLHFTIDGDGQSPTLCSKDYIFFGTVTATLEAASGNGIVSAFILQSDDLDEIDWEWLGGQTATVQSNYFSKGNTTTFDRGGTHNVANPQSTFHTYSINWTPSEIEWIIDGSVVRTLEAASVGDQYPQTPMQVRIGTWCGGCAGEPEGTIQWAGGPTTFDNAPYVMTITSLNIQNANPGSSYRYGDHSGLSNSIIINNPAGPPNGPNLQTPPSSSGSAPSSSSSSPSPATDSSATPPTLPTAGGVSSQTISFVDTSVETVNTGPTSTTLSIDSGASTVSFGITSALVFGAIVFLAGI